MAKSSSTKFHESELQRRCRVCAGVMGAKPSSCKEEKNRGHLLTFGITVENDTPDVHLSHFCLSCRSKAVLYSSTVPLWCMSGHHTPNRTVRSAYSSVSKKGTEAKKVEENHG